MKELLAIFFARPSDLTFAGRVRQIELWTTFAESVLLGLVGSVFLLTAVELYARL